MSVLFENKYDSSSDIILYIEFGMWFNFVIEIIVEQIDALCYIPFGKMNFISWQELHTPFPVH